MKSQEPPEHGRDGQRRGDQRQRNGQRTQQRHLEGGDRHRPACDEERHQPGDGEQEDGPRHDLQRPDHGPHHRAGYLDRGGLGVRRAVEDAFQVSLHRWRAEVLEHPAAALGWSGRGGLDHRLAHRVEHATQRTAVPPVVQVGAGVRATPPTAGERPGQRDHPAEERAAADAGAVHHRPADLLRDARRVHQGQRTADGRADHLLSPLAAEHRRVSDRGVDPHRPREHLRGGGAIRLQLGGDDDLGVGCIGQLGAQSVDPEAVLRRDDVDDRAVDGIGHQACAKVIGDL